MHQQISSPLHVLLKADPHLEGDVADDKADPLLEFFCHSGCTVLANMKGWQVVGNLVPQEAPVNS